MSIFDKTFAELEEKYKTTYKQDENESFEKIKEKFNIGKTENSEKPDIKLSTRATITINGIESEVFEEDIIEAIKNSNAKSILPYKEQIAYYNKITSKEEKDRLLMVFASALIASHNMVWKDIVLQDGEKIIKEMSDSGVYIVEKATNNEITKESKCH